MKKNQSVSNNVHAVSPGRWLFTLVAAALLVMFLLYLSRIDDTEHNVSNQAHTLPEVQKNKEDEYDFYKILPNRKVDQLPTEAYAPKTQNHFTYMLQTGSFKRAEDAERQKAQIAFLGKRARVDVVTVNATTWYRVQLGPFESKRKANAVINQLEKINIKPMIKTRPRT